MKTILHCTVDGLEIVMGFNIPTMDPMATARKVEPFVQALPEVQQLAEVEGRITARRQQAEAEFTAVTSHGPGTLYTPHEAALWDNIARVAMADIEVIAEAAKPLNKAIMERRVELALQYAVWMQPGGGLEDLIEDEAHDRMVELAASIEGQHKQLTLTGEIVADNRGRKFWTVSGGVWTSGSVAHLKEDRPAKATWEDDLTDDQRTARDASLEAQRISAMTPEARVKELTLVLDGLASQAVAMADKAKITGETVDGKAWYDAEAEKARKKYS